MPGLVGRVQSYLQTYGLKWTIRRGREKAGERFFGTCDRLWQRLAPDEEELSRQRANPPEAGRFSLLIPVYNPRPVLLRALLDSISAQSYADWEACLMNAGTDPAISELLREAEKKDPRFRLIEGENRGISGNTNTALEHARGTWCVLCDHDDTLSP